MFVRRGLTGTLDDAHSLSCKTLQFFTKNNNQWKAATLTAANATSFKEKRKEMNFTIPIMAHNSYLINLASPKPEVFEKSLIAMAEELKRAENLGLDFLVMHPGAHLGTGEQIAFKKIAKSLDQILKEVSPKQSMILLEVTAGQGTNVGYRFEHMAEIINQMTSSERVGICLDTCHVFAAGYDLSQQQGYESTWSEFERLLGLDRLKAFHLNDSKKGLGCRVDRHEHIGKGCIGTDTFAWLMNDERFQNLPGVLETPKGADYAEDRENLALLRSLVRRK